MEPDERTGVRYTVNVGPGDCGMRISLRRRLPEGGLGDVLGDLVSWADGVVTVRRKDGVEIAVPAADVLAAKRVPPPPARRR